MTTRRRRAVPHEAANLRDALRLYTTDVHEALDARLGTLDLGAAEGRRSFSRIQLRGYRALHAACNGAAAEATEQLARVIAALEADLGPDTPSDDSPEAGPDLRSALCPDAVAYVTLGSQLGLAVLRRGIREDDRNGLFALTPDTAAWRAFCDRMRATPPDGPVAERALDDALGAFAIFDAATRRELLSQQDAIQRPTS